MHILLNGKVVCNTLTESHNIGTFGPAPPVPKCRSAT